MIAGGMGMPGQPLAYYAPGTPFGWTTMHPGQATSKHPCLSVTMTPAFTSNTTLQVQYWEHISTVRHVCGGTAFV